MKVVKVLSVLGTLAMSGVLLYGFIVGDFFEDGSVILNTPWGIVSVVDLYVGFVLFSAWIVYREPNKIYAAVLVVLMMVFGFLTASVYLLYLAFKHKTVASLLLGAHDERLKG